MDAFLTDEQKLMRESLSRLLRDRYDIQERRKLMDSDPGWSRAIWAQYAEMGILGAILPERFGGFEGCGLELMLIMECVGSVAALEPVLSSAMLAGPVIAQAAEEIASEILPGVIDGSVQLAWAHAEKAGRHDETFVQTLARRQGDIWLLTGAKTLCLHGVTADHIVVSARTGPRREGTEGFGVFLVRGDAAGLVRQGMTLHDGTRAADLFFSEVVGVPLGNPGDDWPVILETLDRGMVATMAEAVGAMRSGLDLTVAYMKNRKQFGVAIGSNQALQHRAADMLVALEQSRSMTLMAALTLSEPNSWSRAKSLSQAKLLTGRNGRFIAQQSIQLHGGIGVTEEAGVGHFFRRLMHTEQLFGDPPSHLRKLSREIEMSNAASDEIGISGAAAQ